MDGVRDCDAPPIGGRGTLRATWAFAPRPISALPIAGRCLLLLVVPRSAGFGTGPEALPAPCGMIREGVSGEDSPLPDIAERLFAPANCPWFRLKLAGGVILETTGRIPLRAGGAAARSPAWGPSIALRVGAMPGRPMGAFASSRPETRMAVPRTAMPFCSVRDGAAVNPPGARRLA